MIHATNGASVEPSRFEPTVFSAVRRYLVLVIAVGVAALVVAAGYTLLQPRIYRAQGNISAPLPVILQAQNADPGQYLDSQVLLLHSPSVAQLAADIADRTLGSGTLTAQDFSASGGSLTVSPPTTATPGGYGASIIGVSFTGPSARIAQVGLSSALQAYSAVRTATVSAQGSVSITGLEAAMTTINKLLAEVNKQLTAPDPNLPFGGQSTASLQRERQLLLDQQGGLQTSLTQAVADAQAAVSQPATMTTQPATLVNHKWTRAAAIGLLVGLLIGGALAYALARRRRGITDPQDPQALYHAPLMGEIPALGAGEKWRSNGTSATAGTLPMNGSPRSATAEAFRFTAGAIERLLAARGPQLSLAFVSALRADGKSAVVANLALALAEGGTRVLVVDADDHLAARLLPGISGDEGFEHVLTGQRALAECKKASPLNSAVAVLRSGRLATRRMTGAAREKAAARMLEEAKASFDLVLIDTPALLHVADAAQVAQAADAAVIVASPNEPIQEHHEMAERLRLIGVEVAGYIFLRESMPSVLGWYSAAMAPRARSASQSDRRSRVLVDSGHTTATAMTQPPQE